MRSNCLSLLLPSRLPNVGFCVPSEQDCLLCRAASSGAVQGYSGRASAGLLCVLGEEARGPLRISQNGRSLACRNLKGLRA